VFSIIRRIAVDGQEDLPAVAALQEQFALRPLGEGGELAGVPRPDASLPEHLRFFDAMRLWSQAFPPPAAERDHLERFEPLGLLSEDGIYSQADASLSAGLGEGLAAGKAKIDELAQARPDGGGWTTTLHMFNYNLDCLGLGTITAPQWKISSREEAIVTRAVAARAGLRGNHAYEALYAFAPTDENSDQLDGAQRYEMQAPESHRVPRAS
jgi:hypothetical protein